MLSAALDAAPHPPWTRRPSPNPRGAQTAATTSLHKLAHARRGAGARNLSDAQKKALERQRVELSGSAEEMAAMQAEREREKRVEQLCAKAAKRMGNQSILRGGQWHKLPMP